MARPRLEEPIFQIKPARNGVLYIWWTESGTTRSASTWTRHQAEARAFLDRFLIGRHQPVVSEAPTIAEILTAYSAGRRQRLRAKETLDYSIAPLKKHLGNLIASDISDRTAEDYAKTRARANGTIIRELGVLRAGLHWAERHKLIDQAPKFIMPVAHPPAKDDWITRDDATKLVEACRVPHLRLFVIIALATAARSGAILDLTWDRVDLEKDRIDFGQGHGKKRRAVVPIGTARLRDELAAAHQARSCTHVVEYHGKPVNSIKNGFKDAADRAGVRCTPHTLRHTAITWMVMQGVDFRKVARLVEDTERTIEKVYGHHSPDYLRAATEALNF